MILLFLFQFFASFNGLIVSIPSQHPSESWNNTPCDSVPPFNQRILDYVKNNLNKKVARGECWDLAAGALNTHKAKWDGRYKYGTPVTYQKECVYPGDILQFERVVIETRSNKGYFRQEMPHHTAVVYEVHDSGDFTIAHQNYNNVRKVVLTPLKLTNIKSGKVMIYRPLKGN